MSPEKKQLGKGRGIGLPRILGIEVRLDYSWFIVFGLVLWTLASGYFPRTFPGQGTAVYWIMGLASAVLLFASVLAHELSHAVVAQREGLPVPRITLFIFGGMAHLSGEPPGPGAEFRIAVVGPISSFVLAGVFWGLSRLAASTSLIVSETFFYLGAANFILAVFNLIPGFPLDGGRVLRAWLWQRWRDLRRATRVVARIGRGMGTALMVLGVLEFLSGAFVGGLWSIFIGLFLRQAAQSSYQVTALRELLQGVSVAEIMRAEPISVSGSLPLDRLVSDYFYRHHFSSFPVTEDGRLTGLVHINQVKQTPQERWAGVTVEEVMTPAAEGATVEPEDPAFDALQCMSERGRQKIPVVKKGRLVGMVTSQDILELFRIKSDLAG